MMNELEEAYMTLQNACGIEAGDTVKILRKANSKECGWNSCWLKEMDKFIGENGVIKGFNNYGISVLIDDSFWNYPFFVLEKIPKPHWRDTVSPENPVLCYVQDHSFSDGNVGKVMFVSGYAKDIAFPYMVSEYAGFRYAKRVPKSMIESMLKAYDETSEDE